MSYMPKSKSDIHITPDRVWDIIYDEWLISKSAFFDPCPVNPKFNGLEISWKKLNYVNPPYTLLREFVNKAIAETKNEKTTILLLPSKTDQEWFHNLKPWYWGIVWIRGRLKFKNNKWSATQPHFLVSVN